MRKALKICGAVVATPIVLILLVAILLYIPPIQNWAVKKAAAIASEQTGMAITVSHVRLAFPLDLSVEGVTVAQRDSVTLAVGDTIADIRRTVVDIQLLPLFTGNVEVDELLVQSVTFNTGDLIASAALRGTADELRLESHGVSLGKESVTINNVALDGANVDIQLVDSVAEEDTTASENHWKIYLENLALSNSRIAFHTVGDSMRVTTSISNAELKDGSFDLFEGLYQVTSADVALQSLNYDCPYEPPTDGFDYNHISLADVSLGVDSIRYCDPDLYLKLRKGSFQEANGLQLTTLSGTVRMDSTSLYIPSLSLTTAASSLSMSMRMDMNAFDDINPGTLSLKGKAELGDADLKIFMAGMPETLLASWPRYPLSVEADLDGNLQHMEVNSLQAELPTAFKASASGYAANLTDTDRLFADINVDATTYNLNFLTAAFLDAETRKTVRIPEDIRIDGNISANGDVYSADLRASHGGGWLTLDGDVALASMTYNAAIVADQLPLQHFLPTMDLTPFSGQLTASGHGTDFLSSKTSLDANADISALSFSGYDLAGVNATATVSNGYALVNLYSPNDILRGDISLDALLNTDDIKATLACSLDNLDLHALGVTDVPLTTSLCAHIDVESDLDESHKLKAFIGDVIIRDSANTYRARDLEADAFTQRDTTMARLASGDFSLDLAASGGYKLLLALSDTLTSELMRQVDRKYISQDSLMMRLPIGHLNVHSGKSNFVYGFAKHMGYDFREINANITTSPFDGINGYAQIDSLCVSDMTLDMTRLELVTEDNVFNYHLQVKNEKDNPDYCFNALLDGSLFETGSNIALRLYDDKDSLGIKIGLSASLENNGISVRLTDTDAILGYRQFVANEGNYLFLADNNRVSANLRLEAADGTGFQIYSDDDNTDALQDLTLGLHNLNLADITSIIPYCPDVRGIMTGDFHVIQTEKELSVSSSVGVDGLIYEGSDMGNLASEFVYMPTDDGGHYVDGMLTHNGRDIGTIKGTYTSTDDGGDLDADIDLARLPLSLVNGFVPDQIVGLKGYGDGRLTIKGPLSTPDINGTIDLDSAYLVSVPYGIELRFDERAVTFNNSKLTLDNFNMYSSNDEPLTINGYVDFSQLDNMTLNLRMTANNYLLIDAKENKRSEAFGKAYVNFFGMITGPLESMQIRGKLDVLGTTDMTYILRDSPLTTDNQLEGLVTFTDFSSGEEETVVKPTPEGMYMDLRISIDEGARIFVALNSTKTNYLDMMGGGDLRMIYTEDEIRMTGRYTVSEGEMKYSLPVIPLKTFNIAEDSYVEFTGELMNPTLNITATEETKANATVDGTSQSVTFNCGVKISQTLNNMGLQFIIEAPENTTINSELQAMSVEERGKIAVTMLTTGMYLSDNNLSSFSMNDALSSFLQSEINNISGSALRTLDLSVGIDNTTDATGATHTDYTFKFAKRLWNNRVRIVVGGKVSSSNANADNIFDNVALEYRLNQSNSTNLRLFYDRATYDFLEGYVGQYGVGIVWKKQLQSLKQLFKKSSSTTTKPADEPAPDSDDNNNDDDEKEQ